MPRASRYANLATNAQLPVEALQVLEEDITPPGLGQGQSNLSLEAQALDVACRCIRVAHTDNEVFKVVNTLAVALGARRTETGTIKALHAVLLQLVWPDMSNAEARSLTGASMSNCTNDGEAVF